MTADAGGRHLRMKLAEWLRVYGTRHIPPGRRDLFSGFWKKDRPIV